MLRFIRVSCASNTTEKHITQVEKASRAKNLPVVRTCTTATSPTEGGKKNEVEERPGEALTTGGDEMTPGESTGKWREKNGQQQTQFLYLSTSESEESLSSDLEAEEEQEREGLGGKRKGLTTLRKDRRVTDKRVKGRCDWKTRFRYKAVSKQAGKLSQTIKPV